MKLHLIASTLVLSGRALFSNVVVRDGEACDFIAARFAHTSSQCVQSRCVGISQRSNGVIVRLESPKDEWMSCSTARGVMFQELQAVRGEVDHAAAAAAPESLHEEVIAMVSAVSSGLWVDIDALTDTLSRMSNTMWSLASNDWPTWRETLRSSPGAQWSFQAQSVALAALLEKSMLQPFWSRSRRAAIAACMYYYTDLKALSVSWHLVFREFRYTQLLMTDMKPMFRTLRNLEFSDADHPIAKDESTPQLVNLVNTWDHHSATLADTAKAEYLRYRVCPNLEPLLFLHGGKTYSLRLVKLAVQMIDLCRASVRPAALRAVRASVAAKMHGSVFGLVNGFASLNSLADLPKAVGRGFGPGVSDAQASVDAEITLRTVTEAQSWRVVIPTTGTYRFKLAEEMGQNCEFFYRGLGRAIGLAIRYNVSVAPLGIDPRLVLALHPRSRAQTPVRELRTLAVAVDLWEHQTKSLGNALEIVSNGINDGLGPGGFAMIGHAEWTQLFTLPNL